MRLFVLFALIGCKGGGSGPDGEASPLYEIVSEGTGPANEAPLLPLVIGTRLTTPGITGGRGADEWRVEGLVDLDGREAYRVTEGGFTRWYSRDEHGVYYAGSPTDGILEHPSLLVPSTVRLGMAWRVDITGDGSYHLAYEVTDRREEQTAWGPVTAWEISQAFTGEDVGDIRTYAEGIGPLSHTWPNLYNGGRWRNDWDGGVLPTTDQQAPTVQHPGGLALRPAGNDAVEQYTIERIDPDHLSLLETSDGSSSLSVIGEGLVFQQFGELGAGWDPEPAWHCTDLLWAPMLEEATATDWTGEGEQSGGWWAFLQSDLCGPGSAEAALDAHQGVYWAQREAPGDLTLIENEFAHYGTVVALYEDPQGEPRLLRYRGEGKWSRAWRALSLPEGPEVFPLGDPLWGLPPLTMGQQFPALHDIGAHVAHPRRAGSDGLPIAVRLASGHLLHATWRDETGPSAFRPRGYAGGHLSSRTSYDGKEALLAWEDGPVDWLEVDDQGARVHRLGTVDVPVGQRMVGAFRLSGGDVPAAGDALLVVTYDGFDLPDGTQATDARLGDLYTYTTLLEDDPRPVDVPASLTLSAAQAGQDLVVCAPGIQDWTTEGWTLDGHPVAAARPTRDGDCLLLIRDVASAPRDPESRDVRAAGTVPGIGPVRVALAGQLPPDDDDIGWDAPIRLEEHRPTDPLYGLPDGRFVSQAHVYDPSGLWTDHAGWVQVDAKSYGEGERLPRYRPAPDPAGHGLWLIDTRTDLASSTFLYRHDGTGAPVEVDLGYPYDEYDSAIVGLVEGGGVIVDTDPELSNFSDPPPERIAPDGSRTDVDLEGLFTTGWVHGDDLGGVGMTADGTICGWTAGSDLQCRDTDGGERTTTPGFDTFGHVAQLLPVDGKLLFVGEAGVHALDPADMTLAGLDDRSFRVPRYAPDGSLYAVTTDGTTAVRITATAVEDLDLFDPTSVLPDATFDQVIAGADTLLVFLDHGEEDLILVRVPR